MAILRGAARIFQEPRPERGAGSRQVSPRGNTRIGEWSGLRSASSVEAAQQGLTRGVPPLTRDSSPRLEQRACCQGRSVDPRTPHADGSHTANTNPRALAPLGGLRAREREPDTASTNLYTRRFQRNGAFTAPGLTACLASNSRSSTSRADRSAVAATVALSGRRTAETRAQPLRARAARRGRRSTRTAEGFKSPPGGGDGISDQRCGSWTDMRTAFVAARKRAHSRASPGGAGMKPVTAVTGSLDAASQRGAVLITSKRPCVQKCIRREDNRTDDGLVQAGLEGKYAPAP